MLHTETVGESSAADVIVVGYVNREEYYCVCVMTWVVTSAAGRSLKAVSSQQYSYTEVNTMRMNQFNGSLTPVCAAFEGYFKSSFGG